MRDFCALALEEIEQGLFRRITRGERMSTAVPEGKQTVSQVIKGQTGNTQNEMPPGFKLTEMIFASLASQGIYVTAKLEIADLLADGPKTVTELAQAAGADADALYRILRALSSRGVFVEREGRVFEQSQMSDLLRSNVPGSLRDAVIFMGEDWHWEVWGKTLYSVKTGKPAWGRVHGKEVFSFFESNQEASQIFDKAMTSISSLAISAVVGSYDFSAIETLVDIAGGQGRLLNGILEANPSVRGILFDLPYVIEGAKERNAGVSVAARFEFASGDFFVAVPENADAYIMKHIIHDWDDERAVKILTNIKRAMKPTGRVLLVESVVSPLSEPDITKLMDIEMLVSPGGKERTAEEYRHLFARAGLKLVRIVPTNSPYSVIEAVAVSE